MILEILSNAKNTQFYIFSVKSHKHIVEWRGCGWEWGGWIDQSKTLQGPYMLCFSCFSCFWGGGLPCFPVFALYSCFCPVFGPYWCKNPVFLYFDKFLLIFPFLFFPKDSSKSCSYYSLCIFISLNNLDVLMQLHLSGSTYATIIYFP